MARAAIYRSIIKEARAVGELFANSLLLLSEWRPSRFRVLDAIARYARASKFDSNLDLGRDASLSISLETRLTPTDVFTRCALPFSVPFLDVVFCYIDRNGFRSLLEIGREKGKRKKEDGRKEGRRNERKKERKEGKQEGRSRRANGRVDVKILQ